MPNAQSKLISAESHKTSPSPLIVLYELDLSKWGEGISRFTNQPKSDNTPIYFNGNLYQTFPIEVTGFEASGQGSSARPTITVASHAAIISLIIACEDMIGATFTRIKTYECFLDDGDTPNAEAIFQKDIYRVERKTSHTKQTIAFEVSSILDQEGAYLPRCQALKNYCYYIYRYWDKRTGKFIYDEHDPCPYAGTEYFDRVGNATTKELDICGKDLHSCQVRFRNRVVPFGGFPGMEKY